MKLSLDRLARAIGESRVEFYSYYAPSWATPAALEAWRGEVARTYARSTSSLTRPATIHDLKPRAPHAGASLPHAA